jgi:hypothetical protein
MCRWRYDTSGENPIRWAITSERKVQDILWSTLRPVFDDLVDEETLRKVGHSTYRADFGIPSLGLMIEVKYAQGRRLQPLREADRRGLRRLPSGNEPYRQMAVFIYNESCSVQHHGTTRNALLALPNIIDVIIVSCPSHVPAPQRSARNRRPPSRTATPSSNSNSALIKASRSPGAGVLLPGDRS